MNKSIKLSRLSMLIHNHLVENKQKYLLYSLGVFFIGVIVCALILIGENFNARYDVVGEDQYAYHRGYTKWEQMQIVLYFGGLFIFGGMFACISFVNFSNHSEAIFYMNKPASLVEKWLMEFIVRVILFTLVYTVVYYVLDIPTTLLVRSIEYQDHLEEWSTMTEIAKSRSVFHPSTLFLFFNTKVEIFVYCILISAFLSIVGFFMYGAVLFNRFSFFKTLILAFILGFVYFIYGVAIEESDKFMPEGWDYRFPQYARNYNYGKGEHELRVEYPEWVIFSILYSLMFIVPIVLFVCSYLKLKEKEV